MIKKLDNSNKPCYITGITQNRRDLMTLESLLPRLKKAVRIFTDTVFEFHVNGYEWQVETYNGRIVGMGVWYDDENQMRSKDGDDSIENYARFILENTKQ